MMKRSGLVTVAAGAVLAMLASTGEAAFLVQIDTDGADDGVVTFNDNFTFGGDTTTASQSAPSVAPLLPEGDSIFGGDGVNSPDTYVYRYDPSSDADNLVTTGVELGVDLAGNPVFGTGLTGGAAGPYRVYAAWPETDNVSGGDTSYLVESGANQFTAVLDQNAANDLDEDGADVWVLLGTIDYDGSSGIIVTQTPDSSTFVSMRASAVLFEPVPEPTTAALLAGLGGVLLTRRARSRSARA